MKHTSTVLACALLALAGCATDRSNSMGSDSSSMGSGSGSSGSMGSTSATGSSGTSGTASSTGNSATTGATAAGDMGRSSTSQAASGGVVQTIDQITRQDATSMGLATGAAAAGGSMGSPTDKVYRVTVRMDDGTTQTLIAETMPSYKSGDRVRYANGNIQRE